MKTPILTITALFMLGGSLLADDKAVDASKNHLTTFLKAASSSIPYLELP